MDKTKTDDDYALLRHRMVEEQLRARGITDERVLAAMDEIPRHSFLPPSPRSRAYEDGPLSIGLGQTISQPYMVARMTELLSLTEESRVLEIGTGSGYQAAVLATLAGEVWSVERLPDLARRAENLLHALGHDNVSVVPGDGTLGLPEQAPYDAIIVTAAAPRVPEKLRTQLKIDGRMVIPVSAGYAQDLLLIERLPDSAERSGKAAASGPEPCYRETNVLSCVFVPLIGQEGYDE
jgi:protein-L-isoaspartate(D-aspartate) O-methyltransferase